jgi:hypothetical protein
VLLCRREGEEEAVAAGGVIKAGRRRAIPKRLAMDYEATP